MDQNQHVKRFEHEQLFEEAPLTDDQMYQVECRIKQTKIDRMTSKEPSLRPDKNGIWGD